MVYILLVVPSLVVAIVLTGMFILVNNKNGELMDQNEELQDLNNTIIERSKKAEEKARKVEEKSQKIEEKAKKMYAVYLRYKPIVDLDEAARKRKLMIQQLVLQQERTVAETAKHKKTILLEAEEQRLKIVTDARIDADRTANEIKSEAYRFACNAKAEACRVACDAKAEADRIAGDAILVQQKKAENEAALLAVRNSIKGYGAEYLVPHQSVLDDLAEDWGHKEAGQQLKIARIRTRDLVKQNNAAECDYADPIRKEQAIRFVIDAFNGKVDAIITKAKHDNFGTLCQKVQDAFAITNLNGEAFRNARISKNYLEARLGELRWAVSVHELKVQEREEQKQIRDAMKEEEKAKREAEKAEKAAEKEEAVLEEALKLAEARLAEAHAEERAKLEAELEEKRQELAEAHAKKERAISMAQQTRRGHVYIISNVGSFGDDILKIGLTRRLEPLDRVKELGDASVPFRFDVHAMIYSEDAPALETELHQKFHDRRVNKVNHRKEFFRVGIRELHSAIDEKFDVHWTMHAEAQEYRETVALEKRKDEEQVVEAG